MEELEEKDLIDYKKYLRILIKFWYVGILILSIAYFIAYMKIRYATPIYKVSTTLQIKDKSSHPSSTKNFLEGASMFQPYKNLKNEIELIKSYNRIQLVVKELEITWNYILKGSIRDIEVYRKTPIQIETDSSLIIVNAPLVIKMFDDDTYELTASLPQTRMYDPVLYKYVDTVNTACNVSGKKFKYGEVVRLGKFQFRIVKTPFFTNNKEELCYVTARDLHTLTKIYKHKITIAENERSSIINISSAGPLVSEEVDFLSKLSEVYVRKELEDKNLIATNTINFIDSQLNIISDSLTTTETNIQSYKEKNRMFGSGLESESLYMQLTELESMKLTLEIQLRYYEYLKEYLYSDKESGNIVAPSTINITEGTLNKLVGELIVLYQQKNTLDYSSSEKSPVYQTTLIKIKSTKDALIETTSNLVKTSKSSIADLNQRISKLEKEMTKIPGKERNLINIQRKHTINDNIYNYLLQKRAEASIARASNLSDAFVVESPREDEFTQIAPIDNKIYMNHLLMGGACILLFTIVYAKFDNKVHEKDAVVKKTGVSSLGNIPFISDSMESKIVETGYGRLTESFRSIRTNLQFVIQGKSSFVIGVTSCVSGDGKSFCSNNLARAYAISGKKTVLIRGDLRKKISLLDYELQNDSKGLSQFLIGEATLEEIIHKGNIPDMYVVIPGPIPPNASELYASKKMHELLQLIRTKFEVIVFDTPPVGLVSDYISIIDKMDVNLYVIRHEFTPISSLGVIKELKKQKDITSNHFILYNGFVGKEAQGYYYGHPDILQSNNWFKKIFKFKS